MKKLKIIFLVLWGHKLSDEQVKVLLNFKPWLLKLLLSCYGYQIDRKTIFDCPNETIEIVVTSLCEQGWSVHDLDLQRGILQLEPTYAEKLALKLFKVTDFLSEAQVDMLTEKDEENPNGLPLEVVVRLAKAYDAEGRTFCGLAIRKLMKLFSKHPESTELLELFKNYLGDVDPGDDVQEDMLTEKDDENPDGLPFDIILRLIGVYVDEKCFGAPGDRKVIRLLARHPESSELLSLVETYLGYTGPIDVDAEEDMLTEKDDENPDGLPFDVILRLVEARVDSKRSFGELGDRKVFKLLARHPESPELLSSVEAYLKYKKISDDAEEGMLTEKDAENPGLPFDIILRLIGVYVDAERCFGAPGDRKMIRLLARHPESSELLELVKRYFVYATLDEDAEEDMLTVADDENPDGLPRAIVSELLDAYTTSGNWFCVNAFKRLISLPIKYSELKEPVLGYVRGNQLPDEAVEEVFALPKKWRLAVLEAHLSHGFSEKVRDRMIFTVYKRELKINK